MLMVVPAFCCYKVEIDNDKKVHPSSRSSGSRGSSGNSTGGGGGGGAPGPITNSITYDLSGNPILASAPVPTRVRVPVLTQFRAPVPSAMFAP